MFVQMKLVQTSLSKVLYIYIYLLRCWYSKLSSVWHLINVQYVQKQHSNLSYPTYTIKCINNDLKKRKYITRKIKLNIRLLNHFFYRQTIFPYHNLKSKIFKKPFHFIKVKKRKEKKHSSIESKWDEEERKQKIVGQNQRKRNRRITRQIVAHKRQPSCHENGRVSRDW